MEIASPWWRWAGVRVLVRQGEERTDLDFGISRVLADAKLPLEGAEAIVGADQPGEGAEAAQIGLAIPVSNVSTAL